MTVPKLDLFTPIVDETKLHPNFVRMLHKTAGPERDVLAGWADGFVDRDGKFVREFQTTFNGAFWEIYLHAAFRELGLRPDYSHAAPDFVLSGPPLRICAEAVTSNHPDGHRPEWDGTIEMLRGGEINHEELVAFSSVRLANALSSKLTRYRDRYSGLAHVADRPFVVCLAPFEQPLFWVQCTQALRRVLFQFDQPLYIRDWNSGEPLFVGEVAVDGETKPSGAEVPFGLFRDERAKEISAVIFSNTATYGKLRALSVGSEDTAVFQARRYNDLEFGKPNDIVALKRDYSETLLDGLSVYLNPFAEKPIDPSSLARHGVAVHTWDRREGVPMSLVPHGHLICRSVFTVRTSSEVDDLLRQAESIRNYSERAKLRWVEDVLHPVPGRVYTFDRHMMARHGGWTVLVAHDSVDDDWNAQALRGEVQTLADYMRLSEHSKEPPIVGNNWVATPEEALREMSAVLDRIPPAASSAVTTSGDARETGQHEPSAPS